MQMILGKASKTEMIRSFSNLSVNKILDNNYPSLSKLKREHGIEKTEKAIAVVVADLGQSFEGALNPEAIEEICVEISSSFLSNMSLEDVYLCCRDIKLSNTYGKLTINKVMNHLNKHMDERCNTAERKNYNNHLASKFTDHDRGAQEKVEKAKFHDAKLWYMKQTGAIK